MGHLAEARELAAAKLVEDLPRLLLGEVVDLVTLIAREQTEGPAGDVRIPAERLVRRDQAVATEGHRVPGDAGGRIRATRVELEERSKIEGAPRDEALVEDLRARRVAGAGTQEPPIARVQG